jgi:uncharacterized protein YijF (DUF1287 family)
MRRLLLALALLIAPPAAAQDMTALVAAARAQVGVTTGYDPAYVALDFPGGDVPADRGVCTDVLIRAFRTAWGLDLQRVVNHDMRDHFPDYPQNWDLSGPDPNIDHRRVPNLQRLFTRAGAVQPIRSEAAEYLPGDIVSWRLPGNLPHIGIVSDRMNPDNNAPMILHNIGGGAQEDDLLFSFPITGHYRITPEALEFLRALDQPS